MSPLIFGTNIWDTLMFVAFALRDGEISEQQKSEIKNLLTSLFALLPCPQCAYHATQYLGQNTPTLNTKQDFLEYLVQMHNAVNARTEKVDTWTVDSAKESLIRRHLGDLQGMARADQKRVEDHAMLRKAGIVSAGPSVVMNNTSMKTTETLSAVTLSVVIVILIVVIVYACVYITKRK